MTLTSIWLWLVIAAVVVLFLYIVYSIGRSRRLAAEEAARTATLEQLRRKCYDSYVTLSTQRTFNDSCRGVVAQLLPFVDRLRDILNDSDLSVERRERLIYEQIVNNLNNLAAARGIFGWHMPKAEPNAMAEADYLFNLGVPQAYSEACAHLNAIDRKQLSELDTELKRSRFSSMLGEWLPLLRGFTASTHDTAGATEFLNNSQDLIKKYELEQ